MFAHHTDRFMTEKELIVSLKQGDEAAFYCSIQNVLAKVHNFSRLHLSSIAEVEEVVQEVFCKIVGGTYLSEMRMKVSKGFLLL